MTKVNFFVHSRESVAPGLRTQSWEQKSLNTLCSAPCFALTASRASYPALITRATPCPALGLCCRCTTGLAPTARSGRACLARRTCGIPGPALIPCCCCTITARANSGTSTRLTLGSLRMGHAAPKIEKPRGFILFSRLFTLFFGVHYLFLQHGDFRLYPTHLDPDKNGDYERLIYDTVPE